MSMRSIRRRAARGFTLLELTVVLFIISIITGAIVIPLASRIESKRIEDTASLLALAQSKLLAYASKFGYLPCPASATSNGQEPAGTVHATGVCPAWHGFLPAATLGWTPVDRQGYALDAWGNRIRYAVSNQTIEGVTNPFTRIGGVANAGVGPVSSAALFRVCASGSGVNPGVDCGAAVTLAANAAVVVWSVGPNAASGGTSIDEAQNPNPSAAGGSADSIFVSRTRSAGAAAEFDDVVQWIPAPIIAGHLQTAGLMAPSGSGSGGGGGGCSSSNTSSNTSTNTSTNSSSSSTSNTSNNSSSSNNISYGCSSSNSSSNTSSN